MALTIQIYETQSVIYTDTTYGGFPPYGRGWTFTGGNLSSATGPTAQVSYNNPGTYTTTLTVTDFNNVTNSFTCTNCIDVLPASVTSAFSVNPTTLLMSSTAQFTNSSSGLPENPTSYQWYVGGSAYSTATNPTLSYNNWTDVPGAIINDSPGLNIVVSIALDATSSYASDSSSSSIVVTKIGTPETDLINQDILGALYSQEITFIDTGTSSGFLGYPTNSYVFELDYSSATGQIIDGFHSTQEEASITLTGLSGNPAFVSSGVSSINGYIIVEDFYYMTGDPEIAIGRYIFPGLPVPPSKLFFADDGSVGNITDLVLSGNYTLSLITDILNNIYPQLNSAQSDYWNPVFPLTNRSPTGSNPVVYSTTYFTNRGITGVDYEVYLNVDGTLVTCSFNGNTGQGNEPSGNLEFYVMQDHAGNDGVATQLNAAIAGTYPGGTAAIEFSAIQDYNINSGGSPTFYYGLKLDVKGRAIEYVSITDNSSTLNSTYSLNLYPFAYKYNSGFSGVKTCSGMPPILDLALKNYVDEGKRITYGDTIF